MGKVKTVGITQQGKRIANLIPPGAEDRASCEREVEPV